MSATITILIATVIFVVAVRLKVQIGIALAMSGIILGFLARMPASAIFVTAFRWLIAEETIELMLIIYLLSLMGLLLGELGWLSRTVRALQRLISNKKVSAVIPSGIIGLLPMPGGAMLSAPLVEEGARSLEISRERLTFLNYWFRHIWEYTWPLYPGIVLSTALLGLPPARLISAMWPLTLVSIAAGFLIGFRKVPRAEKNHKLDLTFGKALKEFAITTWFVWAVVIFVLLLHFEILPVISIAVLINLLILRQNDRTRLSHLKKAFSLNVIGLIGGVMIFKGILESSGLMESLTAELTGVPEILILFLVPFSIGLVTGVNSAFVGLGFPVLVPLIMNPGFDAGNFVFAYASGFVGVLASPVHLCLLLTKQYYKAQWGGIYRLLAPALLFIFVASIVLLLIH